MKRRPEAAALLLCLALSPAAGARPASQEEPGKSRKGEPTKTEGKPNDRTKTPTPVPTVTVHVKVSAEGMSVLPPESTIDLKGDDPACGNAARPQQRLEPDETTFSTFPVCRVKFRIFITGFDVKSLSVDLAKYKNPMKIMVRKNGPPVVTFGGAD